MLVHIYKILLMAEHLFKYGQIHKQDNIFDSLFPEMLLLRGKKKIMGL